MVYFDVKLDKNLPFTIGLLLEKVQEYHGKSGYLLDWKSETIPERDDYCAMLLIVRLFWKDDIGLPDTVIVKGPSPNNSSDVTFIHCFTTSQHNEVSAYEFLNTIPDVPVARAYYCERMEVNNNSGIIFMQGFTDTGCSSKLTNGLNFEQLCSTVDALAKIQAHSLKDDEWERTLHHSSQDIHRAWSDLIQMAPAVKAMLINENPGFFHRSLDKIWHFFDAGKIVEMVTFSYRKLGLPSVFVHGDMSPVNLVFDKTADNKPGDHLQAIIDWHTVHAGSCCEDIACLLATSCNGYLRREKTGELLKLYHDRLIHYMGSAPTPITFAQVLKAYKQMMPYAMLTLLFKLPFLIRSDEIEIEERDKELHQVFVNTKLMLEDVMLLKKEVGY